MNEITIVTLTENERTNILAAFKSTLEQISETLDNLREFNALLAHRGLRWHWLRDRSGFVLESLKEQQPLRTVKREWFLREDFDFWLQKSKWVRVR